MKCKIFIAFGVILCISFTTSCAYGNITSSNSNNIISSNLENSENNLENSNVENNPNINSSSNNTKEDTPQSSIIVNGDNDQTVLESDLPTNFYYNDVKYTSVSTQNNDLRNKINELLGYLINEDDVESFKEEFPTENYVVVSYIYSRTYNNRVPFYSVIGYDDYEFIIVKSLTYDLYQKTIDFS